MMLLKKILKGTLPAALKPIKKKKKISNFAGFFSLPQVSLTTNNSICLLVFEQPERFDFMQKGIRCHLG